MKYLIIGDSSTNLSEKECLDYNAKLAPFSIRLDDKEYIDDRKIDFEAFLEHLSSSKSIAKTSCPSTQSYIDLFDESYESIFIITISSALSGSYNSALLAKNMYQEEHPNVNIHVFDSLAAGPSEYLLAKELHSLAESDLSFDEIVKKGEEYRDSLQLLFLLDDLSNLEKNGRLSTLQATVAKMFNLKLILKQDRKGQIDFGAKARGTKKALIKLVESMADYKKICESTKVAIFHCSAYEKAMTIKELIEKKYGELSEISITQMFALNSTYAQIGGIIITFYAVNHAYVVERQTRYLEGVVSKRSWGFKSPRMHQNEKKAISLFCLPKNKGDLNVVMSVKKSCSLASFLANGLSLNKMKAKNASAISDCKSPRMHQSKSYCIKGNLMQ